MSEHVEHIEGGGHSAHIAPVGLYFMTYLILMALLGVTVVAARVNFGPFNIVVAMVIAIVKAVFVILNFMGVRFNTVLTKIFVVIGFIWLFLMFLIITDYITRWVHVPGWTP